MIKFSEGELLDLLPAQMKNDIDMICLSYALKCSVERLLAYEVGTMTANFINKLPEKVLDVLAVELRTQYYDQNLPLDIKQNLIKNTFVWHMTAGTSAATEELVKAIFGEGIIEEWYEYGGKPYTYKIKTNVALDEGVIDYLSELIKKVANLRSHLSGIESASRISGKAFAGSILQQAEILHIRQVN